MGFWSLLGAASSPILDVLVLSALGALLATPQFNLLHVDARTSLNKLVFFVFTPSLIFASLARTVTLEDIISWWFMPVNIGITFLIGGVLGWILVRMLRSEPHLNGLIIAMCSSGNLGNLPLIIIPAMCNEDGSPFGDPVKCGPIALSYASFSMALGGFYIWTYTYQLVKASAVSFKTMQAAELISKEPNNDLEASQETGLLKNTDKEQGAIIAASIKTKDEKIVFQDLVSVANKEKRLLFMMVGAFHQIVEELLAPPSLAAILGFVFGATRHLRNLIIGEDAPLHVIEDSLKLLGNGTIPCITLILGGNLIQGLRSSSVGLKVICGVICIRYLMLPVIGIWVVKAAARLGFLSPDPLYHYVLMVQYTLPPAMNIGTMTQLFDVAQEECSVLLLWTYLVASLSLTLWSTIFMWLWS